MRPYAVSIKANRETLSGTWVGHTVTVLLAANPDEASGKALRLARKIMPECDGYMGHSVAVKPADEVVTDEMIEAYDRDACKAGASHGTA